MNSQVFNQDCNIGMQQYPDGYFDWAICDIEYGIGASKPSKKDNIVPQKNGKNLTIKLKEYKHSDWDFKMSNQAYFDELFRVSKNQIIFGGNYYGLPGGYLIWDKLNGENDQFGCEMAWLSFTKRTDIVYYMWSGMMQGEYIGKDVKQALRQIGNKKLNEARIHETQKPIMLYEWIIKEYKVQGRVLDTHLGSGSNRIANYRMGNDFIGFEIDKEKFHAQEARFFEELKTPRLFYGCNI